MDEPEARHEQESRRCDDRARCAVDHDREHRLACHETMDRQRIVGQKHTRLALVPRTSRARQPLAAMLFNHAEPLPPSIHAVFRPDVNEWNGSASLQLVIEHWQPAVAAAR